MEETEKVEFEIYVSVTEANEEELDRITRNLLSELRELRIESARLPQSTTAPAGSKGDPITLGSIAIEVLPMAVPSLIALIQAWMLRGQGRTVKFKTKEYEFEGSPEEFQKLLEKSKPEKKKR